MKRLLERSRSLIECAIHEVPFTNYSDGVGDALCCNLYFAIELLIIWKLQEKGVVLDEIPNITVLAEKLVQLGYNIYSINNVKETILKIANWKDEARYGVGVDITEQEVAGIQKVYWDMFFYLTSTNRR